MIENHFEDVYTKFKLQFYKKIFSRFKGREASLTAVETFSVEAIYALGRPTINEFAEFTHISPQNAAYKVSKLIEKGYINKIQSTDDKREFFLEVTDKYLKYHGITYDYIAVVVDRINERFPKEDLETFNRVIKVISEELMPEAALDWIETETEE